ncbi:hypothetical protein F0562_017378 [Nyssa sinensis]|uniref:Protein kinase domain-containing protein n=1 Tax=Nyssa sinensis TaxID=561372 RepID=A0A5J4ZEY3_9ASTE|nr:hypothetical protein F0562_017378 [Nyssa sinensis]
MDRTIIHHQNKMIRELERLSKLCHDNLMKLIGFVIYEDVALLLHQYLTNGTLAQFLHDSTMLPEYKPDWPTRLTIAIGVAEGLAFLHHVAIIHLDISSGNVLLDANFKPLVGEVEISKLLDPSRGTASISAVAGSFDYIPPEYAYTMQVTAPGNIYSYGVVLLEILTTQLPVDEAFGEGIDLVKWVHSALAGGETPEQILDARLSTVPFAWRKEMLSALKVALLCTDTTPAKRPKMKKVVEMLQDITQNYWRLITSFDFFTFLNPWETILYHFQLVSVKMGIDTTKVMESFMLLGVGYDSQISFKGIMRNCSL